MEPFIDRLSAPEAGIYLVPVFDALFTESPAQFDRPAVVHDEEIDDSPSPVLQLAADRRQFVSEFAELLEFEGTLVTDGLLPLLGFTRPHDLAFFLEAADPPVLLDKIRHDSGDEQEAAIRLVQGEHLATAGRTKASLGFGRAEDFHAALTNVDS